MSFTLEITLLFASALLLIGLVLRATCKLFQTLYIPAAVLGGLIGLVLLQVAQHWPSQPNTWMSEQASLLVAELRTWPGWLIAIVFAGLFLDKPAKPFQESIRGAAQQGIVVWIICLGQIGLGIMAVWALIQPFGMWPLSTDTPIYLGQLIEAGFVGGHGTSAALGEIYGEMGFPESKDLGFFMATVGLVYSVVSGIVFVNLAVRRGWTRAGHVTIPQRSGLEARHQLESIGQAKVNAEVLDPLVFQLLILAGAYCLGIAIQQIASMVYDKLPLFIYTLIGGWMVRTGMQRLGIADLLDAPTIRRLVATAMEFLVVAAVASLNMTLIIKAIIPLSVLLVVGFLWTAVCLLHVGRRLLPSKYWFELGILNYGMSTGVTASGLMLLRIIDKDFESGAAEDYALAAPLSAPFVGGGIVTLALIPSMLQLFGLLPVALITLTVAAVLYVVGIWLVKRTRSDM